MDPQILQWMGYFASGIIAFSMTMNSIVKFRWINLVGASTFAIYGFLIGAFPVMLLNGIIVLVDIYYLQKIYATKHLFDTVEIRPDSQYLIKFLDFHKEEIEQFFPGFEPQSKVRRHWENREPGNGNHQGTKYQVHQGRPLNLCASWCSS